MLNPAYSGHIKAVTWLGSSKADLKGFPPGVMVEIGYQLFRVQCGLAPDDWKPMPAVGPGVREIRVRDFTGAYRALYLATLRDKVYVLHCFQKKSQQTPRRDIELGIRRLKSIPR